MTPEMFRKLASLGLSHEQMAGVLEVFDQAENQALASQQEGKEKVRERWRRWKNKQSTNVCQRLQMDTNVSQPLVRGEDNNKTTEISGKEENKKAAPKALSDLAAFKADLEHDATSEQVDAFAKHRRAKNGQNSAYAARLFRKDAAACGLSVADAIDTAISRGWLTVKPEYLASRQARSTAPPPLPPQKQDFNTILDAIQGKSNVSPGAAPIIDGSIESPDRGGAPGVVQLHAFPARR